MEIATFGAGCFWHVQAEFDQIKGVTKTEVGYMGGDVKNPKYEQVCTDKTGHIEVCQVEYDPKKVEYKHLLEIFWKMHDPTQVDGQGVDKGKQYMSTIFYHNDKQKKEAEDSFKVKEKELGKLATNILPAKEFWKAEE